MKKKLFTIALALCMVFTMIPGGVLHSEVAWADTEATGNVTSVQIAGQTLSEDKGLYYYNGAGGAVGTVSDQNTLNGETPNATFNPSTGTLTLNGLNVNAETGIVWNYSHSSSKTHNLVIKLEGSTNIINSGSTSAINGKSGYPNDGPSLTIIGSGTLTLNGSYGIWVWHDITIGGNVVVNATGSTGGIYNNDSYGKIVIQDKAIVTAEGKTEYGIKADNTNASTVEIKGGTLELKGSTAAMKTAPTFYPAKYSVTASTNSDGSGAVSYDETAFSTYRYLKFTKTATDPVGIYLRTIGIDQQDISVPTDQRSSLGTPYYYSNWVDYGTFASAKAASFDETQKITYDGEDVAAVIAEMNASTITKKSGVDFSNLDKVVWDTLSWSQNSSGPNSWHLNGAIVLCKVKFNLNYPADATGTETKPATRYAIQGMDINTGLPTEPSCGNYTFDGWYTAADATGSKVTDIPNLDKDVTYYAHWSAKTPGTEYTITWNANGGYFKNTSNEEITTTVTSGQEITAPTDNPRRYGAKKYTYTFEGWYTENGMKLVEGTKASGNVTYFAHWKAEPIEYKIIYDTNGGTLLPGSYEKTYTWKEDENDRTIYLTARAERPSYTFLGWSNTENGTPIDFWTIKESNLRDLTFYARWSPLSAEAAQVSINPKTQTINRGDTAKLTVTAIPASGTTYDLTYQWYEGKDSSNKNGTEISGATEATYNIPTDTAVGTHYYYCKVTATRVDNSQFHRVATEVATVTINEKQNTGGSSSGGGGSSSRTDVTTTGSTDSKVTSSPSKVKNETTTDADGNSVTTATVTVSAANQREILKQAKANKSGEIIIKVSQNEVKEGAKVEMNLDKAFIESILNDTDAKLTIQTPDGEKTFTQEELKKLAAEATGNTVTIDPASAGTANPTEPTEPTNPNADKNAKLAKGVENTSIALKSKLTKDGKILLTWTKSRGYKVDKFEFYRSVKKNSGYGKKAFFKTKDGDWSQYLNTKNLKAGNTYYYKVRGVRTIDGQKYYTQWSNKAWRTVK